MDTRIADGTKRFTGPMAAQGGGKFAEDGHAGTWGVFGARTFHYGLERVIANFVSCQVRPF
jgi:hypothetical protein